jgi:hypothetical protein
VICQPTMQERESMPQKKYRVTLTENEKKESTL